MGYRSNKFFQERNRMRQLVEDKRDREYDGLDQEQDDNCDCDCCKHRRRRNRINDFWY